MVKTSLKEIGPVGEKKRTLQHLSYSFCNPENTGRLSTLLRKISHFCVAFSILLQFCKRALYFCSC